MADHLHQQCQDLVDKNLERIMDTYLVMCCVYVSAFPDLMDAAAS